MYHTAFKLYPKPSWPTKNTVLSVPASTKPSPNPSVARDLTAVHDLHRHGSRTQFELEAPLAMSLGVRTQIRRRNQPLQTPQLLLVRSTAVHSIRLVFIVPLPSRNRLTDCVWIAAAAAKINAQLQAKKGIQHVDVPPIRSVSPAPSRSRCALFISTSS